MLIVFLGNELGCQKADLCRTYGRRYGLAPLVNDGAAANGSLRSFAISVNTLGTRFSGFFTVSWERERAQSFPFQNSRVLLGLGHIRVSSQNTYPEHECAVEKKLKADHDHSSADEYLRQTALDFRVSPTSGLYYPEARNGDQKINVQVDAKIETPTRTAERPQGSWQDTIIAFANSISLLITVFTLVGLGITAYFAKGQWDEMKKATRASADAANTAALALDEAKRVDSANSTDNQNAYNLSRESLESVQRAFVTFAGTASGKQDVTDNKTTSITLTLPWFNSGNTPTRRAVSVVNFDSTYGKEMDVKTFDFSDRKGDIKRRQFAVPPKGIANATETIPLWQFQLSQAQKSHLYVWGWFTYRDIFNGTPVRLSEFCDEVADVKSSKPDMTDPTSQISWNFVLCPIRNCSDEECSDYKQKIADK